MTNECYYMASRSIGKPGSPTGLITYDTLSDALAAVSRVVMKEGETRYVVRVVAQIEVTPPPVKITML